MRDWKKPIIRALPVILFGMAIILLILRYDRGMGQEAILGASEGSSRQQDYPMSRDSFLLDTFCSITLYEGGGSEALFSAQELLSYYDGLFSPNGPDSDIERINNRQSERIAIHRDTAELFESISDVYESAGGDLEVTIEPLTSLWDIKERTEPPKEEEIRAALQKIGYLRWDIEEDGDGNFYFVSEDPELRVDVGAFAKGFIADKLRDRLISEGARSGIINLGGNVLCFGKDMDGGSFEVGIRKPEPGASDYILKLKADDVSVVTAGIYERYFEYEGRMYHHIIDPKTGYPSESGLLSVTVVGESSAICDALATTLLIKGIDEGLSFLRQYNEDFEGSYEAYFIDEEMKVTDSKDAGDP